MIPRIGCDPEINIVSIGARILKRLFGKQLMVEELLVSCSDDFDVSIDHIILSLDWLFLIKAVDFNGHEVFINEAKQP